MGGPLRSVRAQMLRYPDPLAQPAGPMAINPGAGRPPLDRNRLLARLSVKPRVVMRLSYRPATTQVPGFRPAVEVPPQSRESYRSIAMKHDPVASTFQIVIGHEEAEVASDPVPYDADSGAANAAREQAISRWEEATSRRLPDDVLARIPIEIVQSPPPPQHAEHVFGWRWTGAQGH